MSHLTLAALLLLAAPLAHARCVAEIIDEDGEPMGYAFQAENCDAANGRCNDHLRTLNLRGARCEVTMDIGARFAPPMTDKVSL